MKPSEVPMPVDTRSRRFRVASQRLLIPLAVLLLVSLACSVPNLSRATPVPVIKSTPDFSATRSARAPAAPAVVATLKVQSVTPVKLPPALVEVAPPSQSALTAGTSPVFYFNQPMEKSSVEAAIKVQPDQVGQFEWLDDATVRFKPSQPVSAGAAWQVTINTGAKAANGLALSAPVAVSYVAAEPVNIAERLPSPDARDVNPSSVVAVTFTRPVVALGGETTTQPPAFTLEPAAQGRGEWLNTSTYVFYPQPALMGGASYTVRLNAALTSTDGAPLASGAPATWTFATSTPQVLSIEPSTEQPVLLDSDFTVTFNQPMDAASVQGGFSLAPASGEPVTGKFTWNDTQTRLTFKPGGLLQRGTAYTLSVPGSVRSQGGAAPGKDFAAALTTVPEFAVSQTEPAAGEQLPNYGGYNTVKLAFSAPVATGQDLQKLITFTPPLAGQSSYRDPEGFQVFVSGYFQPSTSYTLTVSSDLQDRWGAKLGAPFAFTFNSQPAQPALTIPVQMMTSAGLFIPANETTIPASATNINQVNLSRGKLGLQEYIQAVVDGKGLTNWSSKTQDTWPLVLYPKPNVEETVNIPLSKDGAPLDPGLYFLNLDPQPTPQQYNQSTPMLAVVSPIQLVFKTSTRQAFVWAVKVADNTPLSGALMTILDSSASRVGSCTTDASGVCQVDLSPQVAADKGLFVVHGQPGDADFSLAAWNWSSGVNPWDFDQPYVYEGYKPEIYLYTDRPIYRPGQTVNFRVIARSKDNGRYASPSMNALTVDVLGPFDITAGGQQKLTSLRLSLDAYGSAAGVYTLPEDAPVGGYTLRINEGQEYYSTPFEVAQYRKPDIDLQVKFIQADLLAGKDVQAQVTARYFFGAPASNLTLRWTLTRQPGYLNLPEGLTAGKVDTSWLDPWFFTSMTGDRYVMEGQAQVGQDGAATITIPGKELLDQLDTAAEDQQALKLEVTLEDESGYPVSSRATMQLHPASYVIGIRGEQWSGQVDQAMTYAVRTLDWQGSPVANQSLSAHFRKVAWEEHASPDPAFPPELVPKYTDVGSTDFRTSDRGEARLSFTPTEPGTYMVELSGEGGALTQSLTWVGGAGSVAWPNLANQRLYLRSDATSYQSGQTAHIFIPNPYPDGALALVTVERAKVMRSMVIPIEGASYDLQVALSDEDAPNVYVSVVLLGRSNKRPDFRMSIVALKVAATAQLLQVSVASSPQQVQPGGSVTLNIHVKDSLGKPVQGEFSLALIDKAVLALADPNAPTIEKAFYGDQPLGVANSLSLAVYAARFVSGPPGRGGGGDMAAAIPVRTKYADTAYWNAAIQTDVTGAAQVTVELPDNLTTWQADARGLTSDTRVGQATVDLVTTKPLLIRPVAPRFVVAGDHIQLAAVVNNNTQAALQSSARLDAAGFSLDDPNLAVQSVSVPAGGRQQVTWWGTVQDVASLDLTFSVEAAPAGQPALSDAARPELNPVPVLRYAASQTFGTSGMLPEGGERTELVSLPRSFTPLGGSLYVELSPSLSAAVLDGLKVMESYPQDFTEPLLSRLLPNLAAREALKDLKLGDDARIKDLETAINDSTARLIYLQNQDGGWGWSSGAPSDAYITSYALLALSRASQAGVFVDAQVLTNGRDYLNANLPTPSETQEAWVMDRLAFASFALQQAGSSDLKLDGLYNFRDKLSPWGKACLALALHGQSANDERVKTLVSDLESSALRSSTGASWQDASPGWYNWSTPNFTTSVVAYALARLDPTSQVLLDAVRYLVLNRQPSGAWASSYESAWALTALTETMRATGDAQASYTFSAHLNDTPVIDGKVETLAQSASPVDAHVSLDKLNAAAPNALVVQRGAGSGRLYYRAFLQVDRPVEAAPAVDRGISLARQYYRAGQDCRKQTCQPLDAINLADAQPVQVRLTLTLAKDLHYVVVEDYFPSGTEVLNPRLKTSQQNVVPTTEPSENQATTPYDLANPFDQGWGWWRFNDPQVYDDHIRWVVDALPAGTYELTYRLTPVLAGEFRVIPAHAWEYYFPDVEGSSQGQVIQIK